MLIEILILIAIMLICVNIILTYSLYSIHDNDTDIDKDILEFIRFDQKRLDQEQKLSAEELSILQAESTALQLRMNQIERYLAERENA